MKSHPIARGRLVDGVLKTPIQDFRHADGRVITFVSCNGIAEPAYFEELANYLDTMSDRNGVLQVEALNRKKMSDPAFATDSERASVKDVIHGPTANWDMMDILGVPWIHACDKQSALAPHIARGEIRDASSLDIVRLLGPEAVNQTFGGGVVERHQNLRRLQPSALKVMKVRFVNGIIDGALKFPDLGWRATYMKDYREVVASLAALEASTSSSVQLLWHPGHTTGIGDVFVRNGFVPDEPQWCTAARKM